MRPETPLAIVVAFTGFLLKTSLGFFLCWAIAKVIASPARRFLIWFGFLVGAVCYWLWLAAAFLPHQAHLNALSVRVAPPLAAPLGRWQIQPSLAFPLSIVLQGLGLFYLLALGQQLFARARKQIHLRWILRFAYRAPATVENFFQPIAESMGAGSTRLLILSGIYSPATFGWIRPTVLLPPFCLEQEDAALEDIFRHELQHVRRRDFVFNTLASLCRTLLFFHPAAWCAMSRLEMESELACDQAVVCDSIEHRATYAECLVRFARLNVAQEPTPWNLDFAGSSMQLKVRIRSILAETGKIPRWLLGLRATLGLLLLAGFLGALPSLSIVLSYQRNPLVQPLRPRFPITRRNVRLRRRPDYGVRLHEQPMQAEQASPVSPRSLPAAAPEAATSETALSVPRLANRTLSDAAWPTLKQRNAFDATKAPDTTTSTIIPIENPSDSKSRIAKTSSVASMLATGASEALRIVSHGRDRVDH